MGASCYQNVSVLRRPTGFLKVLQVILALTCLGLIRHYILSFGGRDDDGQSYYDRELLGKTSVGGMVLVTLPALIGAVFGQGRHTLTVGQLIRALTLSLLHSSCFTYRTCFTACSESSSSSSPACSSWTRTRAHSTRRRRRTRESPLGYVRECFIL